MKKYCANYFFKAQKIAKVFRKNNTVTLQFFQRHKNTVLAGIDQVLDLLKTQTNINKYSIKYLPEGSEIKNKEVVLELEGPYQEFGYLEGVIDGILARATSIASNARECLQAAKGKEVIFMGDRSDYYINQEFDGRAVEVGGLTSHSTNAGARGRQEVVFGSIPHAIIQIFQGDVVKVMRYYQQLFPEEELVALVDFNRDVVGDSLRLLREFGSQLKGVRVDTSSDVSDKMFDENSQKDFGITPKLIKKLREALDNNGGKHVKIIVSSGFFPQRIARFEAENTPVDAYGVGEFILKVSRYFSADAVKIDGKECAKPGRQYQKNERLRVLDISKWCVQSQK